MEIAGGILLAMAALVIAPLAIMAAIVIGPLLLAILMIDSGDGWRMFFSYPIYAIYAVVGVIWLSGKVKS